MAYQIKEMKRNSLICLIWAIAITVMFWLSRETSWYISGPIIIAFLVGVFFTVRNMFLKMFYVFFSGVLIGILFIPRLNLNY